MMNLAPQGPSLKCMVQEFAVPMVVGPVQGVQGVRTNPSLTSLLTQWSVSGHRLSNSQALLSPLPCLPVLLLATLQDCSTTAAPATTERSLCGLWYRNKFCGLSSYSNLPSPVFGDG
jgi:hypothetical protein